MKTLNLIIKIKNLMFTLIIFNKIKKLGWTKLGWHKPSQ